MQSNSKFQSKKTLPKTTIVTHSLRVPMQFFSSMSTWTIERVNRGWINCSIKATARTNFAPGIYIYSLSFVIEFRRVVNLPPQPSLPIWAMLWGALISSSSMCISLGSLWSGWAWAAAATTGLGAYNSRSIDPLLSSGLTSAFFTHLCFSLSPNLMNFPHLGFTQKYLQSMHWSHLTWFAAKSNILY